MFLSVYFLFVPYSFGFDTIYAQKEKFKNSFVTEVPNTNDLIGTADRIEADALLELASEKILVYQDYNTATLKELPKSKLLILIMPRIDLLGLNIGKLAKTSYKILSSMTHQLQNLLFYIHYFQLSQLTAFLILSELCQAYQCCFYLLTAHLPKLAPPWPKKIF